MLDNSIRFLSGSSLILPTATAYSAFGAKVDSGYSVQLKVPEGKDQSVTATLYVVQKHCDITVKVTDPRDGSIQEKLITNTEPGVVKVPIDIDFPKSGELYKISVTVAALIPDQFMMMGISGVFIEERK